ncbi:MAG: VOC family protein [Bacteroidales bacterium]|nr:VOC family protein [Bacteroidales bacterium]
MLRHIALTVNDSEEVNNFYEEVLLFNIKHKHSVDEKVIRQIFNVEGTTDVYIMENQNVQFEVFISPEKEQKVFSHVCLAFRNAEVIYNNTLKLGYKAIIKHNPDSRTYFIWDKSGNMFEIKEMNKYTPGRNE